MKIESLKNMIKLFDSSIKKLPRKKVRDAFNKTRPKGLLDPKIRDSWF